jgi:hypothetical protein
MKVATDQMGTDANDSRSEFEIENHPLLELVENTGRNGVAGWLGVRDDFRTWFVQDAA